MYYSCTVIPNCDFIRLNGLLFDLQNVADFAATVLRFYISNVFDYTGSFFKYPKMRIHCGIFLEAV